MPHPVIVGVDQTERARDAVALGRVLATASGAELMLAHVYPFDERQSRFLPERYEHQVREDAGRGMESLAEATGSPARLLTIADRSPARGLHRLAEGEQAQFLVTASSHRGPVGRTFLGDVAQQTLHGSPCGVAIAPLGYAASGPAAVKTIGVGFDGEPESRVALTYAATLVEVLGAELRLLASSHVAPIARGAGLVPFDPGSMQRAEREHLQAQIDEAIARLTIACPSTIVDGVAVDELVRFSREVDLLVLGSRGFGPAKRLLLGTTSDAVVRRAACPVLVLPRAADAPPVAETAFVPVAEGSVAGSLIGGALA